MRTLTGVVAGIALASLAAGCGGESEAVDEETFTAKGYVEVHQFTPLDKGEPCVGMEGYSDISAGTEVVVKDGDGTKVGLGELGMGKVRNDSTCRLPFTVEDVPSGGGIYSIEVGHRGGISFKQSEAGHITMSIGN